MFVKDEFSVLGIVESKYFRGYDSIEEAEEAIKKLLETRGNSMNSYSVIPIYTKEF